MNFFKKLWHKFNSTTPRFWVRIGHGIVAATTVLTASEIIRENHVAAIIVMIVGAIGYFFINFFEENNGSNT